MADRVDRPHKTPQETGESLENVGRRRAESHAFNGGDRSDQNLFMSLKRADSKDNGAQKDLGFLNNSAPEILKPVHLTNDATKRGDGPEVRTFLDKMTDAQADKTTRLQFNANRTLVAHMHSVADSFFKSEVKKS